MGVAIGIDLGTTNSAAAIDCGQARVLANRLHKPCTPSVVSFRKAREPGGTGEIYIGEPAVNNAKIAPEETIFSIKRMIGRTFDDPAVQALRPRLPYVILQAEGDHGISVRLGGSLYTPAEVSAIILRRVVEDAESALGQPVTHAVITVPAYFNEAQRAATREAGQRAGLVVKKIIDEPTAAAIAFGMDHLSERHRVVVFDMGGGTFDVSVIQMVRGQFEVLGIGGDPLLGGDDFDRELVQMITGWCIERTGHDPSSSQHYLMAAKQAAEQYKILLSGQREVDVRVPGIARTPAGAHIDVDMVVSHASFEGAIRRYVDRSMDIVRGVLDGQHLRPEDISAVLMVGGSTAVPAVHRAVAALFGADKIRRTVDPMLSVALGAATVAARLGVVECPGCGRENPDSSERCEACQHSLRGSRPSGGIHLGEVTARNLGIRVINREGMEDAFAVIIAKGTPYPLQQPHDRYFQITSERLIRIPVYEGEDEVASRNDLQGVLEFPLPEDVRPNSKVAVQFNYDQDRILTVSVRFPGRDDLNMSTPLLRNRPRELDDERWRQKLTHVMEKAEKFVHRYGALLDPQRIKTTEQHLAEANRALTEGNRTEGRRLYQALWMTIRGSDVASLINLVEEASRGAEASRSEKLQEAVTELKRAHTVGDQERVTTISHALRDAVKALCQERAKSERAQRSGDGLLMDGYS